jgi:hypothetical protein
MFLAGWLFVHCGVLQFYNAAVLIVVTYDGGRALISSTTVRMACHEGWMFGTREYVCAGALYIIT